MPTSSSKKRSSAVAINALHPATWCRAWLGGLRASLRWQKRSPLQTLLLWTTLVVPRSAKAFGDSGACFFHEKMSHLHRRASPIWLGHDASGPSPALSRPGLSMPSRFCRQWQACFDVLQKHLSTESCFIARWYATCAEGSLQSASSFAAGLISTCFPSSQWLPPPMSNHP